MPGENTGKGGTMAVSDFEALKQMAITRPPVLLASKVGKIVTKKAGTLLHEYAASSVGKAYKSVGEKILGAVGEQRGLIPRDSFGLLEGFTAKYGAEVVIQKLAKIAKQANDMTTATSLKALFPKS